MSTRKRADGEGSISYHASKRLWVAMISLPGGKRRYLYARTRKEAADRLAQALQSQRRGIRVTSHKQTVASYLDRWLAQSVKPNVRPWTYKGYEAVVRVHLVPTLGRVELLDLTPQQVQDLLGRKLAEGLAPKTVQSIRGVLRSALNEAMRWDLISRNAAALARAPRAERKPISPLGPDEARQLLAAAALDRLGALYTVALAMGLRQGEALGLTWDRVDLESSVIRVDRQLQRVDGKPELVSLKTPQSRRELPLPASVAERIVQHKQAQAAERAAAGSRWRDTDLVFTTTIGTGLDGPTVTKAFQRLLKDSGLARRRFHDLRHSCASLLLVQNVPPRVVMEILGHSQINLTMNTYSHVLPGLKVAAAESMEMILAPARRR